jgi:hypothetical protein
MNRFGLCPCVVAACVLTSGPGLARDHMAIDFRSGTSPLVPYGSDAEARIKPDGRGLRITLPADRRDPHQEVGVQLPMRLRGDFEIVLAYELLAIGDPTPEAGAGLQLRVTFDTPTATTAVVSRLRKRLVQDSARLFEGVKANGETYGAVRYDRGPDGKEKLDAYNFRAVATAGRLKLVRVGPEVRFSAADGAGSFHQLRALDFGTADATGVRVFGFTGYRPVSVDIRLTELVIDALPSPGGGGRTDPLPDAAPTDVSPPASGGRSVLGVILFITGLLGLAGLVGAYAVRRRRDRPAVRPTTRPLRRPTGIPLPAVIVLVVTVFGCSIHANRSFAVKDTADFRFIPPFQPYVNTNMNGHLGAEYFNIAKALAAGEGFANPFPGQTGPTAWMAPVLPVFEGGLLWASGGSRDTVMAVVVFVQVFVLIGTGVLILAVSRRTTGKVGAVVATFVYLAAVVGDFHAWFQYTHDCWLVLLTLDLLVAALVWLRPLATRKSAVGWGLLGGFGALVSPIVGFVWGAVSLLSQGRGCWQSRHLRFRLGLAALVAGVVVAPWAVRNYAVFGRLIPVKSNAAYELYQSQCLTRDGLIRFGTWAEHPYHGGNREFQEYKELGEIAFLDHKREQFWEAVRANPRDFLDRMGDRLFATTVWYAPMDQNEPDRRPWVFWASRLTHPLPFLAALLLVVTAVRRPLHPAQWAVIGIYALYLLPYIAVSYYERYAFPLLGVKALLVIWGVDRLMVTLLGGGPGRRLRLSEASSFGHNRVDATQVSPRPIPAAAG